jgi:hypothetical protein
MSDSNTDHNSIEDQRRHRNADLRQQCADTSALPTAMFSSDDPALEADLAQATGRVLSCLMADNAPRQPVPITNLRLEQVTRDEIASVFARLAVPAEPPPLPVDAEQQQELLHVLLDCCRTGLPSVVDLAAWQLHNHCDATTELGRLTAELQSALDLGRDGGVPHGDDVDARIVALCQSIALQVRAATGGLS